MDEFFHDLLHNGKALFVLFWFVVSVLGRLLKKKPDEATQKPPRSVTPQPPRPAAPPPPVVSGAGAPVLRFDLATGAERAAESEVDYDDEMEEESTPWSPAVDTMAEEQTPWSPADDSAAFREFAPDIGADEIDGRDFEAAPRWMPIRPAAPAALSREPLAVVIRDAIILRQVLPRRRRRR